jgi:hypothetical protein
MINATITLDKKRNRPMLELEATNEAEELALQLIAKTQDFTIRISLKDEDEEKAGAD